MLGGKSHGNRGRGGAGSKCKVKKQCWAAVGKEVRGTGCRSQPAALGDLGASRQQPRRVSVGAFLYSTGEWPRSLREAPSFQRHRRHRWSQGVGSWELQISQSGSGSRCK